MCACVAWNSTTTVNWPAECLSRHNRNRGKSDVFFRRREFDVFVGRSPFDGPRIGREFGQKMIASSPCVSPPLICYSSSSVGWVGKTGFKWRSIKDGRRTFSRALYSAFMELFFFCRIFRRKFVAAMREPSTTNGRANKQGKHTHTHTKKTIRQRSCYCKPKKRKKKKKKKKTSKQTNANSNNKQDDAVDTPPAHPARKLGGRDEEKKNEAADTPSMQMSQESACKRDQTSGRVGKKNAMQMSQVLGEKLNFSQREREREKANRKRVEMKRRRRHAPVQPKVA